MARKRDRAFAIFGAVLFFATSFGFSIWVIWSLVHSSPSTTTPDATSTSNTTANTSTETKTSLAGTQLQNFTPTSTVDTLQTTDTKLGSGTQANAGDTVTVDYVGAVAATGKIFQASSDSGQAASLSLSQVIEGWQKGIPGMKIGGTRRLLIPASEAYGASPPANSGIPANAPLVFDVTLEAVGN